MGEQSQGDLYTANFFHTPTREGCISGNPLWGVGVYTPTTHLWVQLVRLFAQPGRIVSPMLLRGTENDASNDFFNLAKFPTAVIDHFVL
jgi:hypothetical protein